MTKQPRQGDIPKLLNYPIIIQNFDGKPFLLLSILSQSPINRSDLNVAFNILKDFYTDYSGEFACSYYDLFHTDSSQLNEKRFKEIGSHVIGRKINGILKNEPEISSQLNNVLAQKEKIATMMFEGKHEEDETSEEETFEWLRHMQLGLFKGKIIDVRKL